jgi:hypothetical protein
MQDLSEIVKIKEAAEADLLKRPGVTAVDVGYKYVGGQRTDEIAIRIHVAEKKDVPLDEQIPKIIEGIKTDVLQNTFVLLVLSRPVTDVLPEVDVKTYNPLLGGISIGPCRAINGHVHAGTLGAIVLLNGTSTPMMLSNFHVMAVDKGAQAGDTMTQPSLIDGGGCPNTIAGLLQRTSLGGSVDCAVASLTGRDHINGIIDIGFIKGVANAVLGMAVRKRGRTTGLTFGTIDSVAMTQTMDYGDGIGNVTLTNQIGVKVDSAHSTLFDDRGDSGSVVVNEEDKVIGLLYLGSEDGKTGVANPIQSVLEALNISISIGHFSLRQFLLIKGIDPSKGLRSIRPPVSSLRSFMGI